MRYAEINFVWHKNCLLLEVSLTLFLIKYLFNYYQIEMKQVILHRFKGLSFLIMFLLICSIKLPAQTNVTQDLTQYLFPEFSKSTVKMKKGGDITLMLNYNTVTERMVFEQKDQFFDMVNQETVDTAYLQNRKFVPFGKAFYEVLVNAPVSLFIQHRSNLMAPGKPAAYGGTSEVSASTYLSSIYLETGFYNFKLPSDYKVKASPVNWVRINDNLSSFFNERQFLKIFPQKEGELKKFIKENKIKFEKHEDL